MGGVTLGEGGGGPAGSIATLSRGSSLAGGFFAGAEGFFAEAVFFCLEAADALAVFAEAGEGLLVDFFALDDDFLRGAADFAFFS